MGETAQTLDRGLRLLHLVADAPGGLTVTEAAERLGVGRAVVYRLVGALTAHGMVRRDDAGRLRLGAGVLHLARRAQPLLVEGALPALRRLAEEVGATAHLTVAEGTEAVALAVVEPSWTAVPRGVPDRVRGIRSTAGPRGGRSWPGVAGRAGRWLRAGSCRPARTGWRRPCSASRGWRRASGWWRWERSTWTRSART